MQMCVDQPRRDDLPVQLQHCIGVAARLRQVDAGYQWSDQTDIGVAKFAGGDVGQQSAGQQSVEAVLATRGAHRPVPQRWIVKVLRFQQKFHQPSPISGTASLPRSTWLQSSRRASAESSGVGANPGTVA